MAFVGWENCDSGRTVSWLMLWGDGRRFLGPSPSPHTLLVLSDPWLHVLAAMGPTVVSLVPLVFRATGVYWLCVHIKKKKLDLSSSVEIKAASRQGQGSVLMCLSVDLSWSHFILAIFHTQMSLSSCLSHFCSAIKLSGLWCWWPHLLQTL